jgi:hypothetical protein
MTIDYWLLNNDKGDRMENAEISKSGGFCHLRSIRLCSGHVYDLRYLWHKFTIFQLIGVNLRLPREIACPLGGKTVISWGKFVVSSLLDPSTTLRAYLLEISMFEKTKPMLI